MRNSAKILALLVMIGSGPLALAQPNGGDGPGSGDRPAQRDGRGKREGREGRERRDGERRADEGRGGEMRQREPRKEMATREDGESQRHRIHEQRGGDRPAKQRAFAWGKSGRGEAMKRVERNSGEPRRFEGRGEREGSRGGEVRREGHGHRAMGRGPGEQQLRRDLAMARWFQQHQAMRWKMEHHWRFQDGERHRMHNRDRFDSRDEGGRRDRRSTM